MRRATVRGWEYGTIPLFGVPYGQLRQLAETLNSSGATVGNDVNELLLASQCDVLIIGMLSGEENYAEVPPIGERTPKARPPVLCSDGRPKVLFRRSTSSWRPLPLYSPTWM